MKILIGEIFTFPLIGRCKHEKVIMIIVDVIMVMITVMMAG